MADELGDLRALLSARDNAVATRMQLAKHVNEIELLPRDGGTIEYKGEWALLGDGDALRSWDGAEGGNCSQLPLTLRPVITFAGIIRRAA